MNGRGDTGPAAPPQKLVQLAPPDPHDASVVIAVAAGVGVEERGSPGPQRAVRKQLCPPDAQGVSVVEPITCSQSQVLGVGHAIGRQIDGDTQPLLEGALCIGQVGERIAELRVPAVPI